jgi:hypothetical protein
MKAKFPIKPTFSGWIASLVATVTMGLIAEANRVGYHTTDPVQEAFQFLMVYSFATAIVAIPSCLIATWLTIRFIPSTSAAWHPLFMGIAGAVCGAVVIQLLAVSLLGAPVAPDFYHRGTLILGIGASTAGAVCGFVLARSHSANIGPVDSKTRP